MIKYKEIDRTYFEAYDKIPMFVHVKSIYAIEKINGRVRWTQHQRNTRLRIYEGSECLSGNFKI